MATQLQIRRGTSSQVAAFTGAEGEVVVNTTNDSIHVNDGSTAGGFELARADLNNVSDTSLNAALTGNTVSALTVTALTTGSITTTGDISFGDNDKAIFGAGSDLQIYHDGSASYIQDTGTGALYLQGDGGVNIRNAAGTENKAVFASDGAVTLYHNNAVKFATTSTGIDVTGSVVDIVSSATGGTTIELDNTSTGGRNFTLYSSGSGNSFGAGKFALYDADAAAVRMLVDSSGNVGIGTSSPATALEVNGTIGIGRIAGGYTFRETVGGGERASLKSNASNELLFNIGAASEAMRIDSSGNVGIGNATVNTFYDTAVNVYGSGNSVIQFQSSNTGTASGDGFAVGVLNGASTDAYIWNRESSNLLFGTGGAERMRIDSSGNVGIATNLPSEKFTVEGVIRANRASSPTQYGDFAQDNQGGYISTHRPHASLYENFRFLASNNSGSVERMRIDTSGNLLVGTTNVNPAANNVTGHALKAGGLAEHANSGAVVMRLNRTDSDGDILQFYKGTSTVGSVGTVDADLLIHSTASGHGGLRFGNGYIAPTDNSGQVDDNAFQLGLSTHRFTDLHLSGVMYSGTARIGTTTRNSGATVNIKAASNGIQVVFQNSSGTTIGYIGNVSNTSTIYSTSSDERLKTNIAESSVDAGSKIDAIQVRQFDWKIDGTHQDYGMVAQELQTVAPEAVLTPENPDDMMAVDYSKLVPMLVKEIQSLRARVAQLEK
jgi:hypothetical protein